jgi:hypothetical protein
MKRFAAALVLCSCGIFAVCGAASAQPIQLYGTVGRTPAFLDISRNGDTVSGWYLTLRSGKQIRLEGKLDPKGFFQIEAFAPDTNSRTGSFSGRRKGGHWTGTWRNPAGHRPLPLSFDELRSKLGYISGHFRCTGVLKDPAYGIAIRQTLDMTIAKGRVKSLAIGRTQSSDGEEQSCHIASGSMRQRSAPVGILLRARADRTDGSQHCTIRLYGAGDYLVVKPGNPSQSGDDCRGAGTARFCSANGFWSDLVLNRKTQVCRPVN